MNKIDIITKKLRADLAAGIYPSGSRFPSEYELAELLGVHKITANKAVSLLVNEGLLSRGKRGSGTQVVRQSVFPRGFIAFIGGIHHTYGSNILHGVQQWALTRDYLVTATAPPFEHINYFLKKLQGSAIKGIISVNYGRLETMELPAVYLDLEDPEVNTVNCDNYQGGCELMQVLLDRGHRDIVIYTRDCKSSHRKSRLRGFHKVMKKNGINDYEKRTFAGLFSAADTLHTLKQIISHYPHLTAIATDSDDDAMQIIKGCHKLGLRFPDKISITGFGNLKNVCDLYPIASVEQNPVQMGAAACNRLIDIIEHKAAPTPIHELLDIEIIHPEYIRQLK